MVISNKQAFANLLVWCDRLTGQQKDQKNRYIMELLENKLTDFIHDNEKAKWRPINNHNIKEFTEDEIKSITKNHSTPIGKGDFGHVYQGVLDD
jgi:hypothetical protein